jgi:VIT1/CCC1 family predicted Fe2+/Mn2+ transporter
MPAHLCYDDVAMNPLFNWGLVLRYVIYGALPLIAFFILIEKIAGEWSLGFAILVLAALAPFIAIGWLTYQNFRKR